VAEQCGWVAARHIPVAAPAVCGGGGTGGEEQCHRPSPPTPATETPTTQVPHPGGALSRRAAHPPSLERGKERRRTTVATPRHPPAPVTATCGNAAESLVVWRRGELALRSLKRHQRLSTPARGGKLRGGGRLTHPHRRPHLGTSSRLWAGSCRAAPLSASTTKSWEVSSYVDQVMYFEVQGTVTPNKVPYLLTVSVTYFLGPVTPIASGSAPPSIVQVRCLLYRCPLQTQFCNVCLRPGAFEP